MLAGPFIFSEAFEDPVNSGPPQLKFITSKFYPDIQINTLENTSHIKNSHKNVLRILQ